MALLHARGFSREIFAESPWYDWLEPALSEVARAARFPAPDAWTERHAALASSCGVPPLRFVGAPPKKPRRRTRSSPVVLGELYEGRIVERAEVPTRLDDWHDFFNALAFLAFPAAKWALHARQYRLLKARIAPHARRLPGARTREQDALSLLDEGGILAAVTAERAARLPSDPALFERELTCAFEAGDARAVPFGHALFEHLVLGRDDMLGTLVVVPMSSLDGPRVTLRGAVDRALSALLCDPTQFQEPSHARGLPLAKLRP